MIGVYIIPPLVVGMAAFYLWLIHHFWLRNVFKEESKPMAVIKSYRAREAFQPVPIAVLPFANQSHSKGLSALNPVEEFTQPKPSANIFNMKRPYICGCAGNAGPEEL